MEETAMQTRERTDRRQLRCEELNRAQQEVQNRWTEAERWHRRQMAESRQQALARLLTQPPVDKSRLRQTS
jgi:hypothetical protein